MNPRGRNWNYKVKKIQGAVPKSVFVICEFSNKVINLKNNKYIFDRELKLHPSNLIKTCTESLVLKVMGNMEKDDIRIQYLSKLLSPKMLPLIKDVLTPSEYLLGNNLNERLSSIKTSQ